MIEAAEVERHAGAWGVGDQQILKDHLISHLLNSLSGLSGIVFFGGTALNRTDLTDRRLSEDIDLFQQRLETGDVDSVIEALRTNTKREFPGLQIQGRGRQGDVETFAVSAESTTIRVQMVGPRHDLGRCSVDYRAVSLRYSDLPAHVLLAVPTTEAFVAMKCAAFEVRRTPRDLFDLSQLVAIEAVTSRALDELRHFRGFGPVKSLYGSDRAPASETWNAELGHQVDDPGSPADALASVRDALERAGAW